MRASTPYCALTPHSLRICTEHVVPSIRNVSYVSADGCSLSADLRPLYFKVALSNLQRDSLTRRSLLRGRLAQAALAVPHRLREPWSIHLFSNARNNVSRHFYSALLLHNQSPPSSKIATAGCRLMPHCSNSSCEPFRENRKCLSEGRMLFRKWAENRSYFVSFLASCRISFVGLDYAAFREPCRMLDRLYSYRLAASLRIILEAFQAKVCSHSTTAGSAEWTPGPSPHE